jgi:hypothetical protein
MDVERLARYSAQGDADRLKLVRHLVALANSGGGRIMLGVSSAGDESGLASEVAATIDADSVGEIVEPYLRPDTLVLTVDRRSLGSEREVVEIGVAATPEPPLVLARAGTYRDGADVEQTVFAAGSVYARHHGRTGVARRDHYRQWRRDAIEGVRRHLRERLDLVIDAPLEAYVRVLGQDEVLDQPSYFLSRAADLFRVKPDQLLPATDLVYLWLNRATLQTDDTSCELIVQSALRKRATLYPWLAVLSVTPDQVRRFLFGAVTMKDRDKSDAARSMLTVCALYFGEDDFGRLVAQLAESSYAHMRQAAEAMPDLAAARRQLDSERMTSEDRSASSDSELLAAIDDILTRQGASSRRVPALGLELLDRKLAAQRP